MKKVIPVVIVLAALAAVALVFLRKNSLHHVRAVDLAPAETIFFAHFPDIRRTNERWPRTALAQIGKEPEWQAFMVKPRSALSQMKMWDQKVAQLERADPGEAFVAVTSIEGNQPRFLAGISYAGQKSDMDALLAEARTHLKQAYPAGKSDVTLEGKTEIDTFTHDETTIGEAYVQDWYFVSNDMALLRHTIDFAGQGLGGNAVGAGDLYRKSTARLPADGDFLLFSQVGSLTDRIVSLLVASGQAADPKQVAELKKIQAFAWSTKLDDSVLRDTLFVLSSTSAAQPPLPQKVLALGDADTLFTYAAALPLTLDLPDSPMIGALVPSLGQLQKGLSDRGLKPTDFGKAFGPEFGAVVDWATGAAQPSTAMAMDVRDVKLARNFVEAFMGNPSWPHEDKEGVTMYHSPAGTGFIPMTGALALTDHFLVLGFSQQEVIAAAERLATGKAVIEANPAFEQARHAVTQPTGAFAYLDLKALFERAYGTFRPYIAMSLAFSPDSAKYVDAGKLPSAETFSRHLSPAVYSQAVSADGTLTESVGPLSLNHVVGLAVAGAVTAAFPMIEKSLTGGKLDLNSLQVRGSAPAPSAPAAPPRSSAVPTSASGLAPTPAPATGRLPQPEPQNVSPVRAIPPVSTSPTAPQKPGIASPEPVKPQL